MRQRLTNLWWKMVFAWKKRTGWLDLGRQITITGTVVDLSPPDIDGDRCFNVRVDPQFEWCITGFGGRLTTENPEVGPALQCEIPPWSHPVVKAAYDKLKVGDRVCVAGAWGFDGVHTGRTEWLEVLLALVRHQPNVQTGWFEIHPVGALDVIAD